MKQIIRNTVILLIITLAAGFALAFVHEITKDPIKEAENAAQLEAYKAVFPEADTFGKCDKDISAFKANNGVTLDEIRTALDSSGKTLGWVMTLTSSEGYGGDITVAIGVTVDGTLNAMSVISMSETAGLGAKCTSESFLSQFKGIKSDKITAVKDGKDEMGEIDVISGATVTTDAVTNAVNEGLELVYGFLMSGT